jgi:transcriptional regulator with XRE-family HTH domain
MKNTTNEDRDLGLRIGIIVRRHREHQNMTQADLAKQSKVTQAEVSYIERGKRSHLKTLDRVAGALGMKLSEMIHRAENIGDRKAVVRQVQELIGSLDKSASEKSKSAKTSRTLGARTRALAS